jgi:predicted transcriptional regulator
VCPRFAISSCPRKRTSKRAIEAIQALPDTATIDEAIERLFFIAKVDEGLRQSRNGEVVSHDEVKKRFLRRPPSSGRELKQISRRFTPSSRRALHTLQPSSFGACFTQ